MTAHGQVQEIKTLNDQIVNLCGYSALKCYQCGKCSAGCPMAGEMTLKPHEIIRLIQLNLKAAIFKDPSIFLCLTCETCSQRCPNKVEPAHIIDALREIATLEGLGNAPTRIRSFNESFLDQIKSYGRIFEFGMVAQYKLKSGDLFGDLLMAPGMLARGKLKLAPTRIKGLSEIKRIFKACRQAEGGAR